MWYTVNDRLAKRKEPVERAPIDDDGLWWKSRVIIACTVIASLEIVIVIVMIIYWRQIRFYFTKIHCPCDDYLYERRMRRELNRVVPPSDITMEDRQSRRTSQRPIPTVQLQARALLNNPSSEQRNNASEESNQQSVSAQVHREADLEETEHPSITHSTNVESCNEQDTFRDLSVSDISDEEFENQADGFLSKKGYENASFEEEPSSSSLSSIKKTMPINKTKEPECLHRLLTK
ncbi:DgyrCDS4655 [Dimorphilus gyrociliatus]|uniref:DgyrCDS4655 n=1 Tax=Dimorphilus gyrociliatus TaxID=2664684 RepID=A0A7I8VHP3_9ANNE|nr:DgyrCDS4655 [Dimorphilus gyrociliatus]